MSSAWKLDASVGVLATSYRTTKVATRTRVSGFLCISLTGGEQDQEVVHPLVLAQLEQPPGG